MRAMFERKVEVRWSDLDPNFHLRHSAYYDFGAYCRVTFLNEHGITPSVMMQHGIGPVIFREECLFKKEIKFGDELVVNLKLDKLSADASRWTMVHEIWKIENIIAAVITVDGAWLDTSIRKLVKPAGIFKDVFEYIPKTAAFQMPERK